MAPSSYTTVNISCQLFTHQNAVHSPPKVQFYWQFVPTCPWAMIREVILLRVIQVTCGERVKNLMQAASYSFCSTGVIMFVCSHCTQMSNVSMSFGGKNGKWIHCVFDILKILIPYAQATMLLLRGLARLSQQLLEISSLCDLEKLE